MTAEITVINTYALSDPEGFDRTLGYRGLESDRFFVVALLARTDLFGLITPPMPVWSDAMGLGQRLRHQGESTGGFRR
jgi:hypothetical protein